MYLPIIKLLKRMGFSASTNGYKYIQEAITLTQKYPELRYHHLTTHLYPMIAQKYHVSSTSVERCIRSAIESAWLRGDIEFNNRLFQYSIDYNRGKPTNSEFISVVTEYFLYELTIDDIMEN